MSLKKYEDKRNFNNTPEPAAETDGHADIAGTAGAHADITAGNPGKADIQVVTADGSTGNVGGHADIAGTVGDHADIAGNQEDTVDGLEGTSKGNSGTTDVQAFVIQKHYASHLHFDFRLELDGVLKSWAIPKGPSINPKDKKLAVMVEDHPLEYKDFRGVIPEGNYGAGKVYIWDSGTYHALGASNLRESEKLLREGLQKGHLTFILNGDVLKGEFALIRLKKASPKDWLLIKKNDEFAGDTDISTLESADEIADKNSGKKKA